MGEPPVRAIASIAAILFCASQAGHKSGVRRSAAAARTVSSAAAMNASNKPTNALARPTRRWFVTSRAGVGASTEVVFIVHRSNEHPEVLARANLTRTPVFGP